MKNAARAIIFGVLALTGCAPDEHSPSPVVGQENLDFPSLPTNAVLVTVNGRALTKAELERMADLQATLAGVANPDLKAEAIERLRAQMMPTLQRQFLSQALFLQAAEQARIVPTDDDVKTVQNEAVVNFGGGRIPNFSHFSKILTSDRLAALQRRIEVDAKILAYWRQRLPEAFNVPKEEFEAVSNRVDRLNARSKELRDQQLSLANDIYAKLTNGADFAELAKKHSALKNEDDDGYLWGSFAPANIPYPELIAVVGKLKPGEIASPAELDDGIHIIKLISREGSGADSVVALHPEEVTLGRIVLQLPETYEIASEAQIRRSWRRKKLQAAQPGWLKELQKNARIEYPSGTNVWSFLSKNAQKKGNWK